MVASRSSIKVPKLVPWLKVSCLIFPFGLGVGEYMHGEMVPFILSLSHPGASVTWLSVLDSALTDGHLNTWLCMHSLRPSIIFLKLFSNSFFSYISSKSSSFMSPLRDFTCNVSVCEVFVIIWGKKSFCSMTKWKVFNLKVILLISSHPH